MVNNIKDLFLFKLSNLGGWEPYGIKRNTTILWGRNKKKYQRKKIQKCFIKEAHFKIQFEGEWDLKSEIWEKTFGVKRIAWTAEKIHVMFADGKSFSWVVKSR